MTTTQQTEVAVLAFIKQQYESNKPAVLEAIQHAEGGVQSFIVNAIKSAPKPGGLLGTLFGILEPSLESYVANLVVAEGPAVVYAFIDAELGNAIAALEAQK